MRVAVVLSGCGYLDGSEIRESVLALLYLDQQGATVDCFAPDIPQADVVNHLTGQPKEDFRSALEESARIARGKVMPLSALNADNYEAIVLPGGYGAAKNLSDFASKGAECTVNSELQAVIKRFYTLKKPIAAICIAPVVIAASLKNEGIKLTIGDDATTAAAIESLGHKHVVTASDAACIDEVHRVVSCSAYMRNDALAPIAKGIECAMGVLTNLINQQSLSKAS